MPVSSAWDCLYFVLSCVCIKFAFYYFLLCVSHCYNGTYVRGSPKFVNKIFCKPLGEFHQIYNLGALADDDELFRL